MASLRSRTHILSTLQGSRSRALIEAGLAPLPGSPDLLRLAIYEFPAYIYQSTYIMGPLYQILGWLGVFFFSNITGRVSHSQAERYADFQCAKKTKVLIAQI